MVQTVTDIHLFYIIERVGVLHLVSIKALLDFTIKYKRFYCTLLSQSIDRRTRDVAVAAINTGDLMPLTGGLSQAIKSSADLRKEY